MNYSILLLSLLLCFSSCESSNKPNQNNESKSVNQQKEAIKNTIITSYVDGLQNEGDSIKIDQGFHPEFVLLGKKDDGTLRVLPISKWREAQMKKASAGKLPRLDSTKVSVEFVFVDISEDVAVAKLNYFEGKIHTYTDYITLYNYPSGWKMISKVYTAIK
jgi:hypothetical protein